MRELFLGEKLVNYDKRVAGLEMNLFGNVMPAQGKILVKIDENLAGQKFRLRNVNRDELNEVDTTKYDSITFLREDDFMEYKALRGEFDDFKRKHIVDMEGFACWIEEKVLEKNALKFMPKNGFWKEGYEKIKAIETTSGEEAVIDYFMRL